MEPDINDDELTKKQNDAATDIIRGKLHALYDKEPNASEEIAEVEAIPSKAMSKHQLYMKKLSDSGKSLSEIQTAWHEYYAALPDDEKHEVWQEFYSEHEHAKQKAKVDAKHREQKTGSREQGAESREHALEEPKPGTIALHPRPARPIHRSDIRSSKDVKQQLLTQIQSRADLSKHSHHVRSLVFGLSMGLFVVFLLLFSFFNERFVTPFIRPNHNVSATPIIIDPNNSGPVGPEAKIIIPKLNVEAPVVYDEPSIDEKAIQRGLERGVVHYATTPNPGEKGNAVIVGHSSSNILNKGKYKFAFLMLKSLEEGDTFIIQKDSKKYVYKVYREFVTTPNDVSVLGPVADKPATVTLITCDPPGTSTNRLIIVAEQIFPDPNANKDGALPSATTKQQPQKVPGNSESLWSRIWN